MAIAAAFAQPDSDGTFPAAFRDYLLTLGALRPSVILAFPPKAAGTFLRTAAIVATDGQLIRIVHAQGGRDAQPYLPVFLSYYLGALGPAPLVTHIHMQALPANRHFVEALDLKPIVMLRSVSDMLVSYRDMLDSDPLAASNGLNCAIPAGFEGWDDEARNNFLIDVMGPWYASYFATWLEFARDEPRRICVLAYRDFLKDPSSTLERLLAHAGLPTARPACEAAIEEVWRDRQDYRFNRGETGRGMRTFSVRQVDRLSRLLSYYPMTQEHFETLI
jgi:hypothetical protein